MKKQLSIPIQLICIDSDGYHLMVTLSVNGLRANAILDTGASRSVLDKNRVLHYLGNLELQKEDRLFSGIGAGHVETHTITIPALSIGEMVLSDINVVVINLQSINQAYAIFDLPRIDMVLGSDILVGLGAVIDYQNRQLVVSKSE
jgi:hypothetical protein